MRRGLRSRIARAFASLGARGACLYALDRAARWLRLPLRVRSYLIVAQPVPDTPFLPARRGPDLRLRELGAGDPALVQMPLDDATLAFRFDQGARCYGLFRDDRLAAYAWLCFDGYDEDEVRCRFRPAPDGASAWDFDVYVVPEFRLGPAFLKLWDSVNEQLRALGVRTSYSRISAFNLASLRSHRRLSAEVVGRADFLCLGPVQLLLSDLPPRWHLALSARGRPEVTVTRAPAGAGAILPPAGALAAGE